MSARFTLSATTTTNKNKGHDDMKTISQTAFLVLTTLCFAAVNSIGIATSVSAQNRLGEARSPQIPDDLKTMIIATRFVSTKNADAPPGEQFTASRIPLSAFNETDHCVDQASLKIAEGYFRTLGRMLEKAGYYFEVPTSDVESLVSECQAKNGKPPRALIGSKTKIMAYGRVVPKKDAAELEKSLR